MLVSRRNESRLIGIDHHLAFTINDLGHTAYDYPVLAAVVVHLQRQRLAGLDLDALDLEARALLQHGVGAPRARDRAVQPRRVGFGLLN